MHYPTFTITRCLCCKRQGLVFPHCTQTCKAFTCIKWRQSDILFITALSIPSLFHNCGDFFCLTLWIIIALSDIAIAVTRGPATHIHTHAHTHGAGRAAHQAGSVCFGWRCCAFNRQLAQPLRYSAFSQWCGPSLYRSGSLGSLVSMAEENNYNMACIYSWFNIHSFKGSVCGWCLPIFEFAVCLVFLPTKR